MRRPSSSSIHASYRPLFQPMGNPDAQREGSLTRRLSIRERNRRVLNDNLIFNPLRRPRDRLYHELAERHRAARARASATVEPRLERAEKLIRCTIVETDGGSYQSSVEVKNVTSDDYTVYCSDKRNNVNILFEHAQKGVPFELTKIVVKSPSAGYSSPVKEGLVYISMSPILFKDTEKYDRPKEEDTRTSPFLGPFGINCLEGRQAPPATGKEGNSGHQTPRSTSCQPVIPEWGSNESGQRLETEPVAKFQISRNHNSTEIIFNPPITGRFIMMKLFNNFLDEASSDMGLKDSPQDRTTELRRAMQIPPRDDPAPVGDPLRFDSIDDEMEEEDSTYWESQDGEAFFENVDVQAILFYGHSGRRCFPSLKAM